MSAAEPANKVEYINKELNRMLRPGMLPELNYCRTMRLSMNLMADFHIVPEYQPYCTVARLCTESGNIQTMGSYKYTTVDGKRTALSIAVCEAAMRALQELERRGVEWLKQG